MVWPPSAAVTFPGGSSGPCLAHAGQGSPGVGKFLQVESGASISQLLGSCERMAVGDSLLRN